MVYRSPDEETACLQRALAARQQWLDAIASGRENEFVWAKWHSYTAIAGDLFDAIEREVARTAKAAHV